MNRSLAILAAILSAAGILLATGSQPFSRVDAGGPVLRMLMTGRGTHTVVFEAGAGGPLEVWVRVQPAVSKFARTIAYDRAGNGVSPKGGMPRDGLHVAAELHAALHNSQAAPPYLLVGHSLGGPYIRVFAGLYPNEVAGLVLVEPTQEDLIAWSKAREPERSAEHKIRPEDEVDCAPATFEQSREYPVPTEIPVVLIAGMGPRLMPDFVSEDFKKEVRKDQEVFYPAKLKFYREWLKKFPNGRLIIAENSGHGVPLEEPEVVIQAIRDVVERLDSPAKR